MMLLKPILIQTLPLAFHSYLLHQSQQQGQLQENLTQAVNAMQNETQKAISGSLDEAGKSIGSLSEGIKSLNEVLAELGGKTIQIEKKKGGLFG